VGVGSQGFGSVHRNSDSLFEPGPSLGRGLGGAYLLGCPVPARIGLDIVLNRVTAEKETEVRIYPRFLV
jgi:hypothetical protein